MKHEVVHDLAKQCGDFYMHYHRFDEKGLTYLVGTLDFDNPYILKRLTEHKDPCGLPFALLKKINANTSAQDRIKLITKLAESVGMKGSTLVYSWSSNRFRMIPDRAVTKIQGLSSVLRNEH